MKTADKHTHLMYSQSLGGKAKIGGGEILPEHHCNPRALTLRQSSSNYTESYSTQLQAIHIIQ